MVYLLAASARSLRVVSGPCCFFRTGCTGSRVPLRRTTVEGWPEASPPAPVRTAFHHPFVQPYSHSRLFDFIAFLENRRLRSCEFESRTLRHFFPFVCNDDLAGEARSPDFAGFLRGVSGPSIPTSRRLVLPYPASLFRSQGESHPFDIAKVRLTPTFGMAKVRLTPTCASPCGDHRCGTKRPEPTEGLRHYISAVGGQAGSGMSTSGKCSCRMRRHRSTAVS